MKLAICGGGTAGHILPAISIAKALKLLISPIEIVAIGSNRDIDRQLYEQEGLKFISGGGVAVLGSRWLAPYRLIANAVGILKALRYMRHYKPDVVLSTGAYASVPGSLAALLLDIPLVLYTSDALPGRAAKLQALFAKQIAVTSQVARSAFGDKEAIVTGPPLRPEFNHQEPERAFARFGLSTELPILVILGGSQGSSTINKAICPILGQLLKSMSVVHITGTKEKLQFEALRKTLGTKKASRYYPIGFVSQGLADLLSAASLAVSRAGGSIYELTATATPSILIPGEFADGHQKWNARIITEAGAGVMIEESNLSPKRLLMHIERLLNDDKLRTSMTKATKSISKMNAADRIAKILIEISRK
tara:strand:+ start:2380 stop:3471 length:1092 start_codon:yes stop_codon:yes gene_type:complete